jgi:hypothetical protein
VNIIKPPRVFISYAYDSVRHKQRVLEFASFLRAEGGIDIRLDLWAANRRRDWSVWVVEQVREADFVLVVASPAYKRRAEAALTRRKDVAPGSCCATWSLVPGARRSTKYYRLCCRAVLGRVIIRPTAEGGY